MNEPSVTSQDVYGGTLAPWASCASRDDSPLSEMLADLTSEQHAELRRRMGALLSWGVFPEGDEVVETLIASVQQMDGPHFPPAVAPRPMVEGQVIYYLRFADRVKIGTSTNLKSRLKVIPHDELLATEVGGYEREAELHLRFRALRVTGEWFRYDDALKDYIQTLL